MINVTKLIRNATIADNITDEVNVFNYTTDDHFHEKTDKSIIRTHPLPFDPDTYTDDNEVSREYHYQIDIWQSQDELNEQAEKIVELLKVIDFQCYYREPLYESDVMSFRHIIRAKSSILSMKLEENQIVEELKQVPRFLKLNLQHFMDIGASDVVIDVSNFYYTPILEDIENEQETGAGTRIRFLKEIEVDRPQDTEEDHEDDMVIATVVSDGKLSVKTTFITAPADDKVLLNGTKKGVGGYEYEAKDIPPDVAIIFERRNHDESSEWVDLLKGKPTRSSIKGQTKQDKVEFQNDDVEGNFIDRLFDESSHVIGYDKKGNTTGRDYVFMEIFGKTYDEFMSSREGRNMESVEREMKKTEKVEVTSVNVTDEQVTVKIDATKQLSATTEPPGQKVTYAVAEGQTYASVTSTDLVKGLAEGNVTVTATAGKQTDTVQTTVQSNLEM